VILPPLIPAETEPDLLPLRLLFRRTPASTCVMSNINCHRRKIIYSVRTPIIALQSWIIRRIHTSMPVFDDIERNELGPKPYARNPTSFPQRHRLLRDGVLRKKCNLHGKDGIQQSHRNTQDLPRSRCGSCARDSFVLTTVEARGPGRGIGPADLRSDAKIT
jgi:hypothetical protein